MKKLLLLSLALLLALSLFVGCGSEVAVQLEPARIADELLECGAFMDILSPVELPIAAILYGVDEATIIACSVYCSTGATAEEIAIFECVDTAGAEALEHAARNRLESQAAAYASYAPEAVPMIESAYLRVSGVYVVCVVSDDSAAAAEVLDRYMK